MRRPQRENDRVFRGCGLQLAITSAAETFTESQAPGAIQASAEGRMNHHMRAAIFIEKTFHDYLLLRRHYSQRQLCGAKIVDNLFDCSMADPNIINEPVQAGTADVLVRIVCVGFKFV